MDDWTQDPPHARVDDAPAIAAAAPDDASDYTGDPSFDRVETLARTLFDWAVAAVCVVLICASAIVVALWASP